MHIEYIYIYFWTIRTVSIIRLSVSITHSQSTVSPTSLHGVAVVQTPNKIVISRRSQTSQMAVGDSSRICWPSKENKNKNKKSAQHLDTESTEFSSSSD